MASLNITEYCLKQHAQLQPSQLALIMVDDIGIDHRYTYHELYAAVCKLTAGLKSLLLPKGSVVAIQAQTTYDMLILFLSAIAADLVPTVMLLSLSADEVEFILRDSGAKIFFCLNNNVTHVKPSAR